MFGLMTIKAHKAAIEVIEDLLAESDARCAIAEAKFQQAVKDLAAQSDRIGELERQITDTALLAAERAKEIAALTAGVEANATTIAELGADCDEWKGAALRNQADAEKFRAKAKTEAQRKRDKRAATKKEAA